MHLGRTREVRLAAHAVLGKADPALVAIAAQSGTRVASTATTAGLGNPLVSFAEDGLAFLTALTAFMAPLLVPLVLAALLFVAWKLLRAVRGGRLTAR